MKKTILILTSDPFSINYEIIKKSQNFLKKKLHNGCAPARLSEHGGPISLPPHTPRAAQSYSACRQQHGQAASCAPWPGVRAASASGAMLAQIQMVKRATSYAVVVSRARLWPHAFPIPRARSINVSQPAAWQAPRGR